MCESKGGRGELSQLFPQILEAASPISVQLERIFSTPRLIIRETRNPETPNDIFSSVKHFDTSLHEQR